jgi:phage terminase large subunit-like protein
VSGSLREELAALSDAELLVALAELGEKAFDLARYDWAGERHEGQGAPEGDWRVWLLLAGRGFGKTRAGAEWVRSVAERDGGARIALVGASLHDARNVMVEGASGAVGAGERGGFPQR